MHINSKKSYKKTILIIASILVLALAVAIGGYLYMRTGNNKYDSNGISTERTLQDKQLEKKLDSNPDQKQQATQTDHPTTPSVDESTNLQQVNVILTNTGEVDGSVSASGFVSDVVESTGTCTYVFTNGQKTVEKVSNTLTNATSTTCKTVQFSASDLSAGTWEVQLKYSSPTSTGSSNMLNLVVS
jgi:hypothetical protein